MAQELTSRLMALGRAQDLIRPIPGREGGAAPLGDLISVLLAPYDEKGASVRIRVSVPKMNVGESSSTTLALVIHELATNSAKYGSLSVASGTLDVSCNGQDDEVVIMWTERGGPLRWKASAANCYTGVWPRNSGALSTMTGQRKVWSPPCE